MITIQEAKLIMVKSLESFYRHNETLNLQQLQAECINNACFYYLQKSSGLFGLSPVGMAISQNPMLIGKTFGEATQQIVPQFSDAMVANSGLAVLQNSQWEGIEDFLEDYFLRIHKQNIQL